MHDVITHAIEATAKQHGLRTMQEVLHDLKVRHFEAVSVRQRLSFGVSQIRATVKRYEDRLERELADGVPAGDPWEQTREHELLAMFLTCLGELDSLAKAAIEGACDTCGRYGGHLQTLHEGTPDEITLCIECTRRLLAGDLE